MNKQQLIDKYVPSETEIDYLNKFIHSYSDTARERYGKVDFDNLFAFRSPVCFEPIEKFCSMRVSSDNDDLFEQLRVSQWQLQSHKASVRQNLDALIPTHLTLNFRTDENPDFHDFIFLKFNKTLFILEQMPPSYMEIYIVLPFYMEKSYILSYQQDLKDFLDNLVQDYQKILTSWW